MSCISKLAQYGVLAAALAGAPAMIAQTDQGQGASPTTTAPGTGANGDATVPPAPGAPYNTYNNNANPDTGRRHSFGWIGLVGLLGLIGLKNRGRRDVTYTRDERVNPRV